MSTTIIFCTRQFHSLSLIFKSVIISIFLLYLLCSGVTGSAVAAQVTLEWDRNMEPDVLGYKVHYGTSSSNYTYNVDVHNNTSCTISGLNEGVTYFFAATAYNTNYINSGFSNQVSHTVPVSDSDGDGIPNLDEINIYGTDPTIRDTDGDGLNDGAELAFWGNSWNTDPDGDGLINLLDPDSDNDGNTDGSSPPSPPPSPIPSAPPQITPLSNVLMEVGEVNVDYNWHRVEFQNTYGDPVVVVQSLSLNDDDPAVVRIRNVGPSGFDVRIQEWDYLDGMHASESVGYLIMDRGVYQLANGALIEAGKFDTNNVGAFEPVNFNVEFQTEPVVIAAVASSNEEDAVTGRIRNITTGGFDYCLQEQESNSMMHAIETIHMVAWEPSIGRLNNISFKVGRTGDVLTDRFQTVRFDQAFEKPPLLIANIETGDGMDTANVRWQNKNADSFDIQIDEEQSRDTETSHTTEIIGYIALETQTTPTDSDGDGLDDYDEQYVYGTDPNKTDTDNDGMTDGDEVSYWGANWNLDYDNDRLINLLDPDADGDGYSDGQEIANGSDPAEPNPTTEGATPEGAQIWIEAEEGRLNAPMIAASDADASDGSYIWVVEANRKASKFNQRPGFNQSSGAAEYDFEVPDSGLYIIWGRVNADSTKNNSFYVSLDGAENALWETQVSRNWVWDQVNDRRGDDPEIYYLDAGRHTLTVKQREARTKLDMILITDDLNYVPD